jgi:hypothetical protein
MDLAKQALVVVLALSLFIAIISDYTLAAAQPSDNRLPVVLIHGYAQDRSV